MQIIWTRPAMENLHSICDFCKKRKDAATARKLRKAIFDKVENLVKFPALGQKEQSLFHQNKEYRSLLHGNFKIIYRVEDQNIFMVRIFDTRQNPDKLAFWKTLRHSASESILTLL